MCRLRGCGTSQELWVRGWWYVPALCGSVGSGLVCLSRNGLRQTICHPQFFELLLADSIAFQCALRCKNETFVCCARCQSLSRHSQLATHRNVVSRGADLYQHALIQIVNAVYAWQPTGSCLSSAQEQSHIICPGHKI